MYSLYCFTISSHDFGSSFLTKDSTSCCSSFNSTLDIESILSSSSTASSSLITRRLLLCDSVTKGPSVETINAKFLTNQSGQYKGTPFRTFSNGAFIGGYSDHYPTYIVITK